MSQNSPANTPACATGESALQHPSGPPLAASPNRVSTIHEWRSGLSGLVMGLLTFETLTGLAIYLLPFGATTQLGVVAHTVLGLAMLVPVLWYLGRHIWIRSGGNLSHYQLTGYVAGVVLLVCLISGLVITWQGVAGPRMGQGWHVIHLVSGIACAALFIVHLATVMVRKVNNVEALQALRSARWALYRRTVVGTLALSAAWGGWIVLHREPTLGTSFPADYNWRFGKDRPFSPSQVRLDDPWKEAVQAQVVGVLDDQARPAFLAAFEQAKAEPIGLFAQVRRSAEQAGIAPQARTRIEAILDDASRHVADKGAIDARALAGSEGCGTSGCHEQIYQEWLPSAHRYSSMDEIFQQVQTIMTKETSAEHTRYCAGCHDPISLLSGAKDSSNITLSAQGAHEGTSCLVCHSIVQTDVGGNGDYTIRPPERYLYELGGGRVGKFVSDFVIRTYPEKHIQSYSRSLYKSPEYCGACHKQYMDKDVNTDIGKVQGQNQFDSWRNSRWNHAGDPKQSTSCRECHMPLVDGGLDPAHGDMTDYNRSPGDGKHRSHRMLGANQYIPLAQNLPNGVQHTQLIEKWLRGEIPIPEIADKWTTGPSIRLQIVAPPKAEPGEQVTFQVVLNNNKAGHDFPTGPLDMIESWIEVVVTDQSGAEIYHTGALSDGSVREAPFWFKADLFDRKAQPIDRHNLWDLVGAKYKRALYPGVTDTVDLAFICPSGVVESGQTAVQPTVDAAPLAEEHTLRIPGSVAGGKLTVTSTLWYRKANAKFLDRIFGPENNKRTLLTKIATDAASIEVASNAQALRQ
jgi:hypothetical protein